MKDVRPQFADDEYALLRCEADRLGISLRQLVHDRALGNRIEDAPLPAAKIVSDQIAMCREVFNQIIKRETTAEIRLYEDDIIRLEATMENVEAMVAAYITQAIKAVRKDGNATI